MIIQQCHKQLHEADIKHGGVGYLDPTRGEFATPHGFRSTFRDWAAEDAYFPSEVVEYSLAHKLKDKSEAAYQRGTLLLKRARLMTEWASQCRGDVTPEQISITGAPA